MKNLILTDIGILNLYKKKKNLKKNLILKIIQYLIQKFLIKKKPLKLIKIIKILKI